MNIKSLCELKYLKLIIYDERTLLKRIDLLSEIAVLEELCLISIENGSTIAYIMKKLKNLQKLELDFHYSYDRGKWFESLGGDILPLKELRMNFFYNKKEDFLNLLLTLTELVKLYIKNSLVSFDDAFVGEIATIYSKRKNVLHLTIPQRYLTATTAVCDSINKYVRIEKMN